MFDLTPPPKDILLVKAHSMGIGDLIRSSPAWRAIKDRWPQSNLHLLMLSTHPGYPIEQLLREHHLLKSAQFISVLESEPKNGKRVKISFAVLLQRVRDSVGDLTADLVIDFEPNGLRTAALSYWLGRRLHAPVVGVAQFPLRRLFYTLAAPSKRRFAAKYALSMPMDYAYRDFVVLDALKIVRDGRMPELQVSPSAQAWAAKYVVAGQKFPRDFFLLTLNIGCGTDGALPRRPPIESVAHALAELYRVRPFVLYLAGAEFESEVNDAFTVLLVARLGTLGLKLDFRNLAGKGTLAEVTGLLAASDLVVSSDSGLYHIAVALGVPTICWFMMPTPEAHHVRDNVKLLMTPAPRELVEAVEELFGTGQIQKTQPNSSSQLAQSSPI